MTRRTAAPERLEERARAGMFDAEVTAWLDALDPGDVIAVLGHYEVRQEVATGGTSWTPGEHRPGLADERPEVMCAIARCAIARWRSGRAYGDLASTVSHPAPCGWCAYPADELRRALDWAMHFGRFISDEWMVWTIDGGTYRRGTGRAGTYDNGTWEAFRNLPAKEQRYRVDRVVEGSKDMLTDDTTPTPAPVTEAPSEAAVGAPAAREHAPWCDQPADHDGDCPPMPDDDDADEH